MEARSREERDREVREEAKRLVEEKLAKAAKRDRQLEEKLTAVLEGRMSQAELEIDSEAEEMVEAEGSEAVGMEEFGTTGGTQSSAMEVDEEGEDEVVVVEEAKRGEMRKRAPSSPPKSLRKRVRAGTATQMPVGSQVKGSSVQGSQTGMGTAVSTANPCWRCKNTRRCASCSTAEHDVKTAGRSTTGARSCRRRRSWEVKVERRDRRRRRR